MSMSPAAFEDVSTDAALKVLAVSGELDLASAPELRRRVDAALHDGADGIVIDLEAVQHLDSSGLAELIGAHQRATERDSKVVLVLSSQPIRRTLEIRGLA